MAEPAGPANAFGVSEAFTELNAGDSSRASHVWRVETPRGPEIVRRAWWSEPEVSAFMLGLSCLFGVDPRDLRQTAQAYRVWARLGVWQVPDVLGLRDFRGAEALRVEFIAGETGELEGANARQLGRQIAQVHGHTSEIFGDVSRRSTFALREFYARALRMVRGVAPQFAPENWPPEEDEAGWAEVFQLFDAAPTPLRAVPQLLDWSGSQFVWRSGHPYALVDVESSALAPPELDLCFWELLLTSEQADDFRAGYAEARPFPDLTLHRAPCRLILLALESEGTEPWREWLARPALFS